MPLRRVSWLYTFALLAGGLAGGMACKRAETVAPTAVRASAPSAPLAPAPLTTETSPHVVLPAGAGHPKPSAPVNLAMGSTEVGPGVYEVFVQGTPTTKAHQLVLEVILPKGARLAAGALRTSFDGVASGDARRATVTVALGAGVPGVRIPGSARVFDVQGDSRNNVSHVVLGTPPADPELPGIDVTLPSGEVIRAVRPEK